MEDIKRYRADADKVKIKCPCCGKLMSGWTYTQDWNKYWIAHVRPNPKGKECWATEGQMAPIKKRWEEKYERVADSNS